MKKIWGGGPRAGAQRGASSGAQGAPASRRLRLLAGLALVGVGAGSFLLVADGLGGGKPRAARAPEKLVEAEAPASKSLPAVTVEQAPRLAGTAAPAASSGQPLVQLAEVDAHHDPVADALYLGNLAPGLRSAPGRRAGPAQGVTAPAAKEMVETVVQVRSGDTLMGLLTGAGATRGQAHAAIEALSQEYDPRRLRPGQEIQLALSTAAQSDEGSELEWLRLVPDVDSEIHVQRDSEGYVALAVERPLTAQEQYAEGRIDTSLFAAAAQEGVPYGILVGAIRAMSFDVDFQRDIQPGDGFELLYESMADETGEIVKGGDLLYVALALGDRERAYYRFEGEDGVVDFFDANGLSARRGLLRTPIDGARVSSNFGMRRHPIQGYTRMHQGIDFAAPTGTPIYAAGDGVVKRAGRNGGYGNYIQIRHGNGYDTAYAHLSKIAQGMQAGTRVTQGEVIGYVGSTGASTGPHLHYEVHVEGKQVDPASVKLPTGRQLEGQEMAAFKQLVREIDERRRGQRRLQVARLGDAAETEACAQGDTPESEGC